MIKALLRSIRPLQTVHFAGMVLGGALLMRDTSHFLHTIMAIIGIVLVWQFTVMINDIYDVPIDRISNPGRPLAMGEILPGAYVFVASLCALTALALALLLGRFALGIVGMCLWLGILYSAPPFRLRITLAAPAVIGLGSGLAFLLGYVTAGGEVGNPEAVKIAVLLCLALAFGSTVKDLKDYEGDRQAGVRTLFTVFGIEKGKKMAAGFVVSSFLLPLFLIHRPIDVIMLSAVGIAVSWDFLARGSMNRVMTGYFLALGYTALRYL